VSGFPVDMRHYDSPDDESEWVDVEPVDELAIEAAMDYCEACGKFTDGETCPACGDGECSGKPLGESGVTGSDSGATVPASGRCCAGGSRQNPPGSRVSTLGVPAALLLLFPLRWFAWRTER
jgi:hypothetical protein